MMWDRLFLAKRAVDRLWPGAAAFVVALALFCAAASPRAAAADVTVRVVGVHSAKGHIRAALCTAPNFTEEGCEYGVVEPASGGLTILRFHDVKPGQYAAQLFHDENDNEEFDTNFIGIPREGFGFSRDAPVLGRPHFRDAVIDVPESGADIMVRIRYSLF